VRKIFAKDTRGAEFSSGVDLLIKLAGFGLLLVYTRYLSPTEFGVLALLYVTVRVVDTVVVQGMTSAVARAWTQHAEAEGHRQQVALSTAFWYAFGSSTLVFGAFALAAGPVNQMLFEEGSWAQIVRWFAVAGILRATQNVPRQILRVRRARMGTGVLELTDFIVAAALNIFFVVVAKMGLLGIAYAEVIREGVFLVVTLVCARAHVRFTFSKLELRVLLRNGLPKVPRGLSYLAASVSDRFFLAHFAATAHLGLYAFGYRFAELLDLGTRPLTKALSELHRLGRDKSDHGRTQVGRFMTYFVALIGVLGLGIVVFTKPLLDVVTPIEYFPVIEIVPLLVLALCLAGTHRALLLGVQIQHGPQVMPRVMSVAALINLACNFWWISRHGMWGAAMATAITHATLLGVAFVLDRRHFGTRHEFGRLARVVASLAIAYAISVWATPENLLGQIAAALAVVLLYPALLGVFGFYTEDELERLRELVNHRITLRASYPITDETGGAPSTPAATTQSTDAAPAKSRAETTASERPLQPR
jgi:O-antigen/teichoic acid export membrane protein